MKIIQIIPSLHGGGAEKFCIDLANELSLNNEVIICSLYDITDNMFMAKKIDSNVKVIVLHKKNGFDFTIFFKIYKLISKEKPDTVNTHLRALLYTILPILRKKSKFFHTVHNIATKETSKSLRGIYKYLFNYFNVTPIAISKKVLVSVQNEYGMDHINLIENGVKRLNVTDQILSVEHELEQYKNSNRTKILLNIGRISKQKNQILLINVVKKLLKEKYDIVLLIIGVDTSPNKFYLKQLEEALSDNIYLLGPKSNIIDYMSLSDIFCLSSIYEGLPITLLEALSMSTIPVSTPAGGVVDVISNNIGFVSKNFSESEYYNVLKQSLELTREKQDILKKNGQKKYTELYDISITAKKYRALYKISRV